MYNNCIMCICIAIEPKTDRVCWRSFAANHSDKINHESTSYDIHGHVGFAW